MIGKLMVHGVSQALADQRVPLPSYDTLLHRLTRPYEFTRRAPQGYRAVDLRAWIRPPLSPASSHRKALVAALHEASRQSGISFRPFIEAIAKMDDLADIEDVIERVQHFALDRKTLLLLGHFQSC